MPNLMGRAHRPAGPGTNYPGPPSETASGQVARNKNNYIQMKMREHREEIERLRTELESATEAEREAAEAAKQEAETNRQERDEVEAARQTAEHERVRLETLLSDEEKEREVLAGKLEETEKEAAAHRTTTRRRLGGLSVVVAIALAVTLSTTLGGTEVVVPVPMTTIAPTTTTKPIPTTTRPAATTSTTTSTTTTLPPKPNVTTPVVTIDEVEVLTAVYEWTEAGERVQLLQQVLGVAVDGIYRGPTRTRHLAVLEDRGLESAGVPSPPTTTTTSTTTTEAPRRTIATGVPVEATLVLGTRDSWHFDAVAGAEVAVQMTGFDTHLRLYGPDGTLVAENDDQNERYESAMRYRTVEAGEYRIDAGGYDDVHHGVYVLTLTGASDNIGACLDVQLTERVDTCSMGMAKQAELTVGNRDVWTFIGVRGSQVQIEMTGFDSHLRLYDADGVLVAENDDHNEHYESFLVAGLCSTGPYTIEAGGYADAHGGEYTLTFLGGETPFEAITRTCGS